MSDRQPELIPTPRQAKKKPSSGMPDWLTEHISTITGRDPGGRYAHPDTCPNCHRQILTGLDEEWCALTARVDPTPLNPLGEALTRIAGGRTYDLRRHGTRPTLWRRTSYDIRARPAGTRHTHVTADVVQQHNCQTIPTQCVAVTVFAATNTRKEPNACPF